MQKKLNTTIFWFIIIQPFLEIHWFYKGHWATILPFTIPTIIRIIGVFFIFMMFLSQKNNWNRLIKNFWILSYIVILIIYSILHIYHVNTFKGVDPNNYGYSNISEIFYLIRMIIPIVLIYVIRYTRFSKKQFRVIVQSLVGLFSLTIVISNLFTVSLTAYGSYGVRWIHANIFYWFMHNDLAYFELASKGYFYLANTVSAVLFMLMPLMLYVLVSHFNWLSLTLTVSQALSMLMLGTKVAEYGLIINLVVFSIVYLIHTLIIKDIRISKKILISVSLIIIGTVAIIPYSPAFRRTSYDSSISEHRVKKQKKKKLNTELKKELEDLHGADREEFLKKFIAKNYEFYSLKKGFVLHSYSYKYDPEFWLTVMKMPINDRTNYRKLEILMLNKVVANNNNKYDKWFGISYIRENNIFPLERDFLSQYYSLGIIGTILFLGVYIISLLFMIYSWLRSHMQKTFLSTSLIISVSFLLAASIYSGNVMDYLTATIILAFITGYALQIIDNQNKKKLIL